MRIIIAALLLSGATPAVAQLVIRSEADLPQTRYKIAAPASQSYMGDAFLQVTIPKLRADAERVLATSRIEDATIRQRLRSGLVGIALLQGRPADAERLIMQERSDQTKPQLKAIGMLTTEAIAAGLKAPVARRCKGAADRVTERLRGTDPNIVRDEVLMRLGQAETASPAFFASGVAGMIDPVVEKQGSISLTEGMLLASNRAIATLLPACRSEVATAWRAWASSPANKPVDVWSSREPDPASFKGAQPVTIAVWDTGVDYTMFPGKLTIDPAEPLDGRDNDGNGAVDDVHGPTYDFKVQPTAHPLAPPSAFLAPQLAFQMALDKGYLDLRYGLDTAEARLFAQRAREASAADQAIDVDAALEVGFRNHGTFVASQIADGLDFVRLYNVRLLPWGRDPKLVPYAEAEIDRFAAAIPRVVRRMREAGVRVVNMSWGGSVDEMSLDLLQTGLERDPAKARARALAMYEKERAALASAFAAAPEILFVAAAGNENQSDATLGAIPQVIPAPNLLIVGAAGQSGNPTAFTTFGDRVRLYARGEGAAGRTPGGGMGNASGTSMAAPNVARAAAQMLAANPKLTATKLVEGLIMTASDGQNGMKLLHAAEAVRWAKQQQ